MSDTGRIITLVNPLNLPQQSESPIENLIRDGLILAASRTYAEQYIEPFIRHFYDLEEPHGDDHDAVGSDLTKYEIKACKVLRASDNRRGTKSLLDRILFEHTNLPTNRLVSFADATKERYDANVQNVKRDHFDVLIYSLLFADCVKIFWVNAADISTGALPGWSDKHGRYDALGKSGQFNVTKSTIDWHVRRTLMDTVSYAEMARIYQEI